MSTPKIIRVLSPSSKSQNQHQTTCSDIPMKERSSLDTIISNQKTSQMENYYSLLIDQVKKLSRDNDRYVFYEEKRMWKLLTETEEQHSECNKTQSKLQQSLQQAEKELSTLKELYDTEKSNFNQSKVFYEKREQEWQSIVGELKKVIEVYESTQEIDMNKASEIFEHTEEMKSKMIEQLPGFDHGLSIYSRRNGGKELEIDSRIVAFEENNNQRNDEYGSIYCTKTNSNNRKSEKNVINVKYASSNMNSLEPHESHQSYENQSESSSSILSTNSRRHRSKLLKSKNFIQRTSTNTASLSTKKICQNVYMEEITRFNTRHHLEHNPEDTMELLTIEDVFERALRKTYIKHRSLNEKAIDIMLSSHMEKLKTAKSSTKERLQKTIRKEFFNENRLFLFESQQELEDIIKFIEEKVYKKYHLLKGELIFKFLEEKFKECEIVYDSSNSALERLDREPSNVINGVVINERFKEFESKKRSVRESANFGNTMNSVGNSNSLRKGSGTTTLVNNEINNNLYMSPQASSSTSNHFTLAINSNIKSSAPLHSNNHIGSTTSIEKSVLKRENSQKNIYTEKRLSRRPLIEQLSSRSKRGENNSSSINSNLSDLIGM